MRIFERFTWLHVLLISLLVAALVGVAAYHARPRSYRATASLLLSDRPDIVSGMVAGTNQATPPQAPALERMRVILTSRSLRKGLVDQFKLAERFHVTATEAVDALGGMTQVKLIGEDGLTVTVACQGYRAPRLALGYPLTFEDARTLCADLANAYLAQLRTHVREGDLEHARQSREFLQRQYAELTEGLASTEDELERLRTSYGLVEPADKASRVSERIRAIEQAYSDASAEVSSTENSLHAAEAELDGVQVMRISSQAQVRNPVLGSLEGRLADLQIQLATEVARGKTSENRDVVQIQSAIDDINQQIAQARETVLKEMAEQVNPTYDAVVGKVIDLHVSVAGARARQARYSALLGQARSDLAELPPVARSYLEITRRQDLQSQQLASVSQALWLAKVEEQRATEAEPFSILDEATPPIYGRGPGTVITALIAFGAVLLILGLLIIDRRWFGG